LAQPLTAAALRHGADRAHVSPSAAQNRALTRTENGRYFPALLGGSRRRGKPSIRGGSRISKKAASMQKLWVVAGILSLVACSKDKEAGSQPQASAAPAATGVAAPAAVSAVAAVAALAAAAAPTTGAAAPAGDPLTGAVSFGPEGPVVVEPAIVLKKGEGGDHATVHGWAADGSELAYCTEAEGTGAHECGFLKPGGKVEQVSDFDPAKGIDEAKSKSIHNRLVAKGYKAAAQTWLYASQLQLAWKAVASNGAGGKNPGVLRAGAQIIGEPEPVLPVYLEAKNVLGMHAEALALSPDGKYLGVISHGSGGEGNNQFDLRVIALPSLVGQVFNDTALAHHKKGEYQRSAELFHKAIAADPANTLAPYNYACALAKLKHPGTEAALKAAIALGGDKVKAKAAKDSDFADVKNEAWFAPLLK
jgi:hypothetical protein